MVEQRQTVISGKEDSHKLYVLAREMRDAVPGGTV